MDPELSRDQLEKELRDTIIRRLASHSDEDDLIYAICAEHHLDWNTARTLVEKIKVEGEEKITARQVPLKTLLAVMTLLIGLVIFIVSILFLADLAVIAGKSLSKVAVDFRQLTILRGADPELAGLMLSESMSLIPIAVLLLVNGLGMVFGSLLGMRETWAWLIERVSSTLWK